MKALGLIAAMAACSKGGAVDPAPPNVPKLTVTSPAFAPGGEIPIDHTCEGPNVAPALAWSGAPPQTKSFAIVVDDPDAPDPAAPKMTWVHWVVLDLPATTTSLAREAALPPGAAAGTNDFGKQEWGGPCPPIGRHRYFFKVYALDTAIGKPGITKADLLAAMKGHVVAEGELIGTYQKQKR